MSFVRTAVTGVGGCVTVRAARVVASALLAPVLLAAAAPAAVAAPVSPGAPASGTAPAETVPVRQGGATATLEGLRTYGQAVVRQGGEELTTGAGLFEMAVDGGGTLQTYGTDVYNPTQEEARYGEADWDRTPLHGNPHAGRILWILRHSYPQVNDLQALAKSSGAGKLTPQTAAAGTQVAVWRYSDAAGGVEVEAVDPAAEKLADHLYRKARSLAEPRASISVDAAGAEGGPEGRVGPVTVRTGARSASLVPGEGSEQGGGRVVDSKGSPVTSVRDGGRLFLDVPAEHGPGAAAVTVQAAAKIPVGRAFSGIGEHAAGQTQILAGSSRSTVSAVADVAWDEHGAVPSVTAERDCRAGAVRLTVRNTGDRPHTVHVADERHAVAPRSSETVTVPVGEDQAFRIPVAGPGGKKTFTGVLDCATKSEDAQPETEGLAPQSQPATAGGGEAAGTDGGDLAETGAGSTTVLLTVAVGLVVVGAVAVLAVRRKKPDDGGEPRDGATDE